MQLYRYSLLMLAMFGNVTISNLLLQKHHCTILGEEEGSHAAYRETDSCSPSQEISFSFYELFDVTVIAPDSGISL
jgi:hypothetical protein